VINDSLDSTFAKVWLGRVLLLVPVAVLLQLLDKARTRWWRALALIAAAGLLVTPVLSGHADTGRWVGLAQVADFAHLAASAVWLGGLAVLLLSALHSDVDDARSITERFSPIAFGSVVVVVLSGTFNAYRQVPTLAGLETSYGRLLIVKIVLVLGLIGVASLTRAALQGRLDLSGFDEMDAVPVAAGPGAAVAGEHEEIGILRRLVGAEVAVAIIVLAVTSLLVDANPGFGATTTAGPSDQTHVVDSLLINAVVVPGTVGPTDVHLYVDNPAGGLKKVFGVKGTFSLPSAGITGIDVPFVDAGPNHWTANNVDITITGKWQLTIDVLVTDIDKKTTTFSVPIGR
jgi:copper transport protein